MTPVLETLRVGRLPYLNAWPFTAAFPEPAPRWVTDVPRRLGLLAAEGALDAALLASRDALALGDRFRPLADVGLDLGIARCGAVGSVLLFSCRPIEELDGARVALTPESRTSRALLRILLADAFGRRVRYVEAGEPADARLAIGDEAIALRAAGRWPFVLDLGAAWHRFTGLPFVYARWVVRRDLAPGAARALASALSRSLAICASRAEVPHRTGMTPLTARAYLDSFQYRLGPAEQAGLRRFHGELLRHDLLRRPGERLAIGSAA